MRFATAKMFDYQLFQVILLLVTCVGVRCEYYSDYDDRPPFYDPCKIEAQTALAEIKSEVKNLRDAVVALGQKLDPDFKWQPVHKEKCPSGFKYLQLAGGCYKVVYENHNWASADERCNELQPGAHLAAIQTADENTAIKTFLRSEHSNNRAANVCRHPKWVSAGKIVWTSGQLRNVSSCAEPFVWKVSNDTQLPLSYIDWDSLEPNCRNDEERCLTLAPVTNYRWNDISCDVAICPLCEYNPVSV